jgi:RHS repeat-associated protein
LTYPNGRVVNLGYGSSDSIDDLFSLVKTAAISGESGNKVDYTRVGLGRFVKISYPKPGVEMSMTRPGGGSMGDSGDPYDGYDRFGRVQEMRWQSSSTGTPIDAWQWGYNEASNRTWKKNLVAASGQDEAYGYDGLYQVIRDAVGTLNTNRTAIGGVPGEEEDFEYDPTGNWLGYRKDANGSVVLAQSRSNNKDNQLTQIDGSSALLSYHRAGNATKTAPGTGGDWTKYYQPVWDAWNRIVEVKNEIGTSVQKNAYDGLTRRITKEASSVVTHTYWSDRWKPLEERVGSASTASRSYLWGERPGHRDELILRDRDTDGNGSLDERLYATMDYFNGTSILNTSGAVQERYAYTAFGERRIMAADFMPRSTSSYAWDFGFQGQFRDAETGWYNYGYRFYVPMLGRWINRDPIEEDGGTNLYAFVRNNSINGVDLLGLQEPYAYARPVHRDCEWEILGGHFGNVIERLKNMRGNGWVPGCDQRLGAVACGSDRVNEAFRGSGADIPGVQDAVSPFLNDEGNLPFSKGKQALRAAINAAKKSAKEECKDTETCCDTVRVFVSCDSDMTEVAGQLLCGTDITIDCSKYRK